MTKDCNGNELKDGDAVMLNRDLKLKGTKANLKRGTIFKNITVLEDDIHNIECRSGKSTLVLKTQYLKKK